MQGNAIAFGVEGDGAKAERTDGVFGDRVATQTK